VELVCSITVANPPYEYMHYSPSPRTSRGQRALQWNENITHSNGWDVRVAMDLGLKSLHQSNASRWMNRHGVDARSMQCTASSAESVQIGLQHNVVTTGYSLS
jgi:hypothetical protein